MTYKIEGIIPEKEFVSIRNSDGKVESRPPNIHKWEDRVRKEFIEKYQGWTIEDIDGDLNFGAYIPLKIKVEIHDLQNRNLAKQHKALGDALAGALYINDCVITDLEVIYKEDIERFALIFAEECTWEKVSLPEYNPVILDRFSRITDTGYDEKGFSLNKKAQEKDDEFRKYYQDKILSSDIKLEPGPKELIALMQCKDINSWTPLPERKAMIEHQKMPTTTPDCDNIAYSLIQNLIGVGIEKASEIERIHIVKDWRPDKNNIIHRVWILNK